MMPCGQSAAIVGLHAGRVERGVAPAPVEHLLHGTRAGGSARRSVGTCGAGTRKREAKERPLRALGSNLVGAALEGLTMTITGTGPEALAGRLRVRLMVGVASG